MGGTKSSRGYAGIRLSGATYTVEWMADLTAQEALPGFAERYSALVGVHSVETGVYAGQPCLVAMAGEGFDRGRLPAMFMGLPVLVNDGTHGYPAEGEPVS
jgi:hypothetical protein